jgi:orotate phosphoribosyltransferase
MTQEQILHLLKETNALLEGHFRLTSGLHSPRYIEKFRLLERPDVTEQLCKELAAHFTDDAVELVIGPMTGGILLAHEVGKALGTKAMFTERINETLELRRGFTIGAGQRVLVVEDVVTTGGSVNEVMKGVKSHGGNVVGVGMLIDRSGGRAQFDVKTEALIKLNLAVYKPKKCPQCAKNVPIVKPGSRAK